MKKRLLLMLVAVFAITGVYALNQGDYVYTKNGRFKITGANLVTNGDFSSGLTGWTNENGKALNTDTFSVEPTAGPTGGPCLKVLLNGGAGSGGSIMTSVLRESPYYYIVTYKAKSASGLVATSASTGGSNFQGVYANDDGSINKDTINHYSLISRLQKYSSDWTTLAFDYSSTTDGYIIINMNNLNVGDCFADFGIYKAELISDDRPLVAQIARADSLLKVPYFTDNASKTTLQDYVQQISQYLTEEDASTMTSAVTSFKEKITEFLDANALNVNKYCSDMDFESISVSNSEASGVKGWNITGGRWFCYTGGYFGSKYAARYYGKTYTFAQGSLSQTVKLPAGKYMFSLDAYANSFIAKTTTVDEYFDFKGVKLFINDDSLDCYPIYPDKPTTYTMFADVPADTTVTFGIYCPALGNNMGFDNAELRLIGGVDADVSAYVTKQQLNDAKYALKVMVDSAQTVHDINTYYFFGKTVLQDSIDNARAYYDTVSIAELALSKMAYVRTAIRNYYTLNKEYTTIVEDIEEGKALIAKGIYTKGVADFQSVIDAASAYIKSLSADGRDSLALVQKDSIYLAARADFYVANASYATPGLVNLVNGDFSNGLTGWKQDGSTDNSMWKISTSTSFTSGTGATFWRGTSAHPSKYIYQDVVVKNGGLYELSALIKALNEKKTTTLADVYFYLGHDSVKIHSLVLTPFSVRAKANAGDTLRIGIDATNNAVYNTITFGNVSLKYFGDYDTYLADSIAAALIPARDSLQREIDNANTLKTTSLNPNNVDTSVYTTAIATAQNTATNSKSLNEINGAIPVLINAENAFKLSGVYPPANTYFDITYAIKNPDFADSLKNWTFDTDTATVSPTGISYYFSNTSKMNSKMTQSIDNLPHGLYELICNGTYRLRWTQAFNYDDYKTNHPMFLCANNDSINIKGLLDGADSTYTADVLKLTIYNYRHMNISDLVSSDLFTNSMKFCLTDTNTATIGFSIVNMLTSSQYSVKEFKLRYWGAIPTGIEDVNAGNVTVKSGDVYSITGAKVRSNATSLKGLSKGLYIFNGKKYVVK